MKRLILFLSFIGISFGVDGMSSKDLAAKAKYLGFDGDYIGHQDPLLEFDGNGNWFSGTLKSFTLSIHNNTSDNQEVVLFPGYMWNPKTGKYLTDVNLENNGSDTKPMVFTGSVDGTAKTISFDIAKDFMKEIVQNLNLSKLYTEDILVVSDGIIFTDDNGKTVECEGNPAEVRELITYIMNHPTWLSSVKLRTDNPLQFSQSFKLTEKTPFKKAEEHTILLEKFTSNKDYQNDLIDIEIGMTVNDLTRLSINVVKESTLSITFMFGGSINMGKYLDYSATKASETARLYNAEPVRKLANISQK